jgi:hypothetical protein
MLHIKKVRLTRCLKIQLKIRISKQLEGEKNKEKSSKWSFNWWKFKINQRLF